MTIHAALVDSADLSTWLDGSINDLDMPAGISERMAAGCFDQVHEHHKAIHLLLKNSLVGSAFSLVRPTLETFVRGLWLLRCASEKEVESFTKDKIDKSFGDLIKEIEARDGYNVGVLSKVKKNYWGAMCSYAHGGYLQTVRRNTEAHITPNYSDDEKLEVVKFADTLALLAASEMFMMANRDDMAAQVLERMRAASVLLE
ncbi:MAG: hypothetical protein WD688_20365 [Candidatus Binatia bacterium]